MYMKYLPCVIAYVLNFQLTGDNERAVEGLCPTSTPEHGTGSMVASLKARGSALESGPVSCILPTSKSREKASLAASL